VGHQEDNLRVGSLEEDLLDHAVGSHLDLQDIHHIVHLQDSRDRQGLDIDHAQVHCSQVHHLDIQDLRIQAEDRLLRSCIQGHNLGQGAPHLRVDQTLEDHQDLEVLLLAFHLVVALGLVAEEDSAGSDSRPPSGPDTSSSCAVATGSSWFQHVCPCSDSQRWF
jgi:hypothetical protein